MAGLQQYPAFQFAWTSSMEHSGFAAIPSFAVCMEIILGASTVISASLLAAVSHECDCHSSLNSLQCPGHPGGFILVGFHFIRTSTKVLSVGDNEFQAFPRFQYNSVVVVSRIQQLFLSSNEDCSTPYDTLFLFSWCYLLHSMYVMSTAGFHCGQRSFFPMN
jgi:hypothetical protein